jgi:mannose-6-phosphate isomerase
MEYKDFEEFKNLILEDHRPWGSFRQFPHLGISSVKIITVNPGGILSLQYHNKRDEFWVILDDGLEVTFGDKILTPKKGDELWIPKGTLHRAKGIGDKPARFFELWVGVSEESDIVRVEDVYKR